MDVYVVPIGPDRYELYHEVAHDPAFDTQSIPEGFIGRLKHKFVVLLRTAEERRHEKIDHRPAEGWMGRLQDRIMAWVAERVAEQRLLWNLRGQTEVRAMHPDDVTFDQALTLIHRMLQRDYDRHKVWLVVDGILFLISFVALGPIFLLIPGIANIPAFYFGFRVIGHWLSMRGASHGLHRAAWTGRACPPLTELRHAAAMPPGAREDHVHAVSARLHLHRFPTFFERVAFGRT